MKTKLECNILLRNGCPDWHSNSGPVDCRSDALPTELKMGDNWLDEGAKEGKGKRGRKRYYCKRKKGQKMTKDIIWKEWLNFNFLIT